MVDDGLDVLGVAEPGNKDAVGAGLEIGLAAFKGGTHGFSGRDAGLPIGVSTGVDDEMNSGGMGGASGGLDARDLLRQRKQRTAVANGFGLGFFLIRGLLIKGLGAGSFRIDILKTGIFRINNFRIGVCSGIIFKIGIF